MSGEMKLSLILEAKIQQFKAAMAEARGETEKLGAGAKTAGAGVESAGNAANKAAAGIQAVGTAAGSAAPAVKATGDAAKTTGEQLQKTGQAAEAAGKGMGDLGQKSGAMQALAGAVGKLFAAFAVVDIAKSFVSTADAMTQLDGKVKLATTSVAGFSRVKQSLFQIANETGVSISDAGSAFSRLSGAVKEAGGSTQDTLNVVRAFGLAAKISGASSNEASNAMIQLGQGMAAGTLRGDELNSVLEAAPRFAKALADSMKVPVGSLKKLAEEGKITAQEIIKVASQMQVLENEAGTMGNTVSGAVNKMQNAWSKWVGEADAGTGINSKLAAAIGWVADHFGDLMQVLTPLSTVFTAVTAIVGQLNTVLQGVTGSGVSAGTAFTTIGLAITACLGPIGLAVAGFTVMYKVMERIQGWMGADKIREATTESNRLASIYAGMVPIMNKLNGAGLYGLTAKIGEIQQAAIKAGGDGKQAVAIAEDFANRVLAIHTKLQADKAKLDELYTRRNKILAGEIEGTEKQKVDAQIREIQKLKQAREQELQKAIADLERYRTAAASAYQRAADAQGNTADKIRELRRRDMSESKQQADIEAQAAEKIVLAKQKLAEASRLAAQGNTEGAEKASQAAQKAAQQAESLGSSLTNTGKAIKIVGEAGDVLVKSEQAVGRANDAMAKKTEQTANELKKTLGDLDAKLKEMETKAKLVEIDADITKLNDEVQKGQAALDGLKQKSSTQIVAEAGQALSEIGKVQGLLDALQDKTVTVTVVTRNVEQHQIGGPVGGVLHLNRGGQLPGYGGGDKISALLEAGEYVVRKERASRFGALVHLINTAPMGVLEKLLSGIAVPRFAVGGPVMSMPSFNLPSLPSLASASPGAVGSRDVMDINLNFGGRKFPVQSSRDTAMGLARALQELTRG